MVEIEPASWGKLIHLCLSLTVILHHYLKCKPLWSGVLSSVLTHVQLCVPAYPTPISTYPPPIIDNSISPSHVTLWLPFFVNYPWFSTLPPNTPSTCLFPPTNPRFIVSLPISWEEEHISHFSCSTLLLPDNYPSFIKKKKPLPLRVLSSVCSSHSFPVFVIIHFLITTCIYYRLEHLDHTYCLPFFSNAIITLGSGWIWLSVHNVSDNTVPGLSTLFQQLTLNPNPFLCYFLKLFHLLN